MLDLFHRAKYIFKTEGLLPLIQKGYLFLTKKLFQYDLFYIIEHSLTQRDENNYMPRITSYIFRMISTVKTADEMAYQGLRFYNSSINTRQRLEKGAIAFCIFVEQELAHIGWVALTEEANQSLFQPPFRVDYIYGEAATGGGWTNPRFRGLGLATYIYYKRLDFLKERGKTLARAAVTVDNTPSLIMHSKFTSNVRAKGRLLKILWYRSWKEIPLNLEIKELLLK